MIWGYLQRWSLYPTMVQAWHTQTYRGRDVDRDIQFNPIEGECDLQAQGLRDADLWGGRDMEDRGELKALGLSV